ncbi:hypothetical protein [Shewanella aestuarii]|uniref:Uncharacterized protein n=1 Tax=Shewanella aestuarii TaxID=1028752 RepID=A0A6G9QQY4_9GAMM|nr:hypothetical protein [Shewanella aestuarii]QIR16513.1 hypothetical protein HBH39_18730 [Shewanella aestuarii]
MNQSTDGMLLGHLPKQMLISDMFTEFSQEDHLTCPFANAYEQVKGVPFFKGKSTPLTLVYNDDSNFEMAETTLTVVSNMTGYQIVTNPADVGPKTILHLRLNAGDYNATCMALASISASHRTVLEITNFNQIDALTYNALATLVELKMVNGVHVEGVTIVLQESRKDKVNENEYAQKLRSLTMTINEQ